MREHRTNRRRHFTAIRKWTPEEDQMVCEKLRETVLNGATIEKPTAKVYYEKMLDDLNLPGVNHIKLKAKVLNLKNAYLKMIDWRSKTGQGVLETDGPESVKAYILGKCPLFDLLDEIFGSRVNVNPPIIIESGTSLDENEELADQNSSFEVILPEFDVEDSLNLQSPTIPQSNLVEQSGAARTPTPPLVPAIPKNLKRKSSDGLSALTEIQNRRLDFMQIKVDSEEKWRSQQLNLEEKKLELEEKKLLQTMDIKKMELEQTERIEKYRIEQEMKCKLEIAKLQFSQ